MQISVEQDFINNYVKKNRRDRLMYELNSTSKRKNVLSKFCHNCDIYIDERKILFKGNNIAEKDLFELIKKYSNDKEAYIICWDDSYDGTTIDLKSAISFLVADGMSNIVVLKTMCIIATEYINGEKTIYILQK